MQVASEETRSAIEDLHHMIGKVQEVRARASDGAINQATSRKGAWIRKTNIFEAYSRRLPNVIGNIPSLPLPRATPAIACVMSWRRLARSVEQSAYTSSQEYLYFVLLRMVYMRKYPMSVRSSHVEHHVRAED